MVNVNAPLPFNLNSTTTTTNKQSRPSLDMERQSVASSTSASASHELDEDMRWPALNVRIVRGGSALARGRPITRDAVMHEPGTGPESGEMGVGAEEEEQPEEAPSEGARPGGRETAAARISGSAFKIQNVGSLSRSWGD
ncbi:hypothetical protein BC827DRAFT_1157311 [Russula dissimulans]|nr:hypothetical protein BC827DRAFT_1157311 [Russula dissimulans]